MMTTELIDLDLIDANPYQPRGDEDAGHIREIANSIRTNGLIQTPVGRLTHLTPGPSPSASFADGEGGKRVQLAVGHNRLAAFRLLDGEHPGEGRGKPGPYGVIPIDLRPLDDEQMFELAVAENVQRKDLNPLEVARAMLRYREEFGKTSAEIGELFGIGDSAVRNKLRLLELPEEARAALAAGEMSEGAGRALLTLYDLPEALRARAERAWKGSNKQKPSQMIQDALNGTYAADLNARIDGMIAEHGKKLSAAPWKQTQVFEGEGIQHPDCKSCPLNIVRDKTHYCLDPACYAVKDRQWEGHYLSEASRASGIAPLEAGKNRNDLTPFYGNRLPALSAARVAGCPNLCLVLLDAKYNNRDLDKLASHPQAHVYCSKRAGHCTCLKAHELGVTMVAPPSGGELGEKELKETRQKLAAAQAEARAQSKGLIAETTRLVFEALNSQGLAAWQTASRNRLGSKAARTTSMADLCQLLAEDMVHRETSFLNLGEFGQIEKQLTELLAKCSTVSVETGEDEDDFWDEDAGVSVETGEPVFPEL